MESTLIIGFVVLLAVVTGETIQPGAKHQLLAAHAWADKSNLVAVPGGLLSLCGDRSSGPSPSSTGQITPTAGEPQHRTGRLPERVARSLTSQSLLVHVKAPITAFIKRRLNQDLHTLHTRWASACLPTSFAIHPSRRGSHEHAMQLGAYLHHNAFMLTVPASSPRVPEHFSSHPCLFFLSSRLQSAIAQLPHVVCVSGLAAYLKVSTLPGLLHAPTWWTPTTHEQQLQASSKPLSSKHRYTLFKHSSRSAKWRELSDSCASVRKPKSSSQHNGGLASAWRAYQHPHTKHQRASGVLELQVLVNPQAVHAQTLRQAVVVVDKQAMQAEVERMIVQWRDAPGFDHYVIGMRVLDVAVAVRPAKSTSEATSPAVMGEPAMVLVEATVYTDTSLCAAVVLAGLEHVLQVYTSPQPHTIQNRFTRAVIQDNIGHSTRFYDHGLTGDGQIVAVGDTGVDFDSCFFSDTRYHVVTNAPTASPTGAPSTPVNVTTAPTSNHSNTSIPTPSPTSTPSAAPAPTSMPTPTPVRVEAQVVPVPRGAGYVNYTHRKIITYVSFDSDGRSIPHSRGGTQPGGTGADAGDGDGEPGDLGDDMAGHGTHVAGTIAGNVQTRDHAASAHLSPYNGLAPDSKLAIYDFKRPKQKLEIPIQLYSEYYQDSYAAGARLSSNSWGNEHGSYDHFCVATDKFSWDHKDFLPIFAAGNSGAKSESFYTISSPGVAKNVLTVGATRSSSASFFHLGFESGVRIRVLQGTHNASSGSGSPSPTSAPSGHSMSLQIKVVPALFGAQWHMITTMTGLVVKAPRPEDMLAPLPSFSREPVDDPSSPPLPPRTTTPSPTPPRGAPTPSPTPDAYTLERLRAGCVPLQNHTMTGGMAVVQRGSCHFTTKAKIVQAAGAAVMIVVDAPESQTTTTRDVVDPGYPVRMPGSDSTITIPCGAVSHEDGMLLLEFSANASVLADAPVRVVSPELNSQYMALFSSKGPTADGRAKPDVVAPGQKTVSVMSDGDLTTKQCPSEGGLLAQWGTSMATPVVAAAAAIVRQYFRLGFYPDGVKDRNTGFLPTASLVKAVLVHSGVPMQTEAGSPSSSGSSTSSSRRSLWSGFGRVELGTVLKLSSLPVGTSPTAAPSDQPTAMPSYQPTATPSQARSHAPTRVPTAPPTAASKVHGKRSLQAAPLGPTPSPAHTHSASPSPAPSSAPSPPPVPVPTRAPSVSTPAPSVAPTAASVRVVPDDWQLFVVDSRAVSTGETDMYCFRIPRDTLTSSGVHQGQTNAGASGGAAGDIMQNTTGAGVPDMGTVPLAAFKATLVWTDPPAAVVANHLLVNNLDLSVTEKASGQMVMGNDLQFTDETGTHRLWDMLNNVEQVQLDRTQAGQFLSVQVRATHTPHGAQPYSLVVTGVMRKVDVEHCSGVGAVCPRDCGSTYSPPRGQCGVGGHCVCADERTGADCSIGSAVMERILGGDTDHSSDGGGGNDNATVVGTNSTGNNSSVNGSTGGGHDAGPFSRTAVIEWAARGEVSSGGWAYFHLDVDKHMVFNASHTLSVKLLMISSEGDPDLYVQRDGFPSLLNFSWISTVCEPCGRQSEIAIPAEQVLPGRYRIGVYGRCCKDSSFRVYASLDPVGSHNPIFHQTYLVLLPVLPVVFLLLYWLRYYRQYRRYYKVEALDLMHSCCSYCGDDDMDFEDEDMLELEEEEERFVYGHRARPGRARVGGHSLPPAGWDDNGTSRAAYVIGANASDEVAGPVVDESRVDSTQQQMFEDDVLSSDAEVGPRDSHSQHRLLTGRRTPRVRAGGRVRGSSVSYVRGSGDLPER